jgi:hypothetical protein
VRGLLANTACENSEVSLGNALIAVAVAVIASPSITNCGREIEKLPLPVASVLTIVDPR